MNEPQEQLNEINSILDEINLKIELMSRELDKADELIYSIKLQIVDIKRQIDRTITHIAISYSKLRDK
ncbi:MAG: hypothetical protein ABWZ79_16735 [Pedobacter agri]